jgi:hypothetical protein
MAAPVKMLVSVIADVVVDVRLLILELLEVNVDISDIKQTIRLPVYTFFPLFSARGGRRAFDCYFETIFNNVPILGLIRKGYFCCKSQEYLSGT